MKPPPGRRFIAWAARFVPFHRRRAWQAEWEAEAAYAWARLNQDGRASLGASVRLRLRIWTCLIDALWEMKETGTMTGPLTDLKLAVRALLRRPLFASVAVLTLALGIGANAAVFTLVDGVLFSPLPYPDADRLVAVEHQGREDGRLPSSPGLYRLYAEQSRSLDGIAMHLGSAVNLMTADGEPERLDSRAVTPSFFRVLGVDAQLGRTFTDAEGAPDADPVVILSDAAWRSSFGADPAAVGRSLDINGTLHQVVGVMPPDFGFPDRNARLWLPLVIDPAQAPLGSFGPSAIARLADGQTLESAQAETAGLVSRLPQLFPDDPVVGFLQEVGLRAHVTPLKESLVGDLSRTLWILLGTVGFVLLIACANVANLLLVRAEDRQREMALRVAVGAGRGRILRSFLSESFVLAAAGGAVAVAVAFVAVRSALAFAPGDIPRVAEVGVDFRVLAFVASIVVGCAVLFGLVPLTRYGRSDLGTQLRDGDGRTQGGGRQRHRLRNGLVVSQIALALVLLVGSGLMYRSFLALRAVDPGFDVTGVLTARITIPTAEIDGWQETAGFFRQLREQLLAQPMVEAVGMVQFAPLTGGANYHDANVEDHPRGPSDLPIMATHNRVEAGYFETLRIDLLEGRTFQPGDGAEGTRSVVVSRSFADEWWPGASPLGRRMNLGFVEEEWYTIVGVVADTHQRSLDAEAGPIVYWPATVGPAASPTPTRSMDLVVRTRGEPLNLVPVLRREVQAINPRIPVSNPQPMERLFDQATARQSFTTSLLAIASGVALILGLVGMYGVISYVVAQRTREIGVRLALGATGASVRRMVVRQGALLAGTGVALGLAAAVALSSVMTSLLYGVSAGDPLTYAAVAGGLVVVAVAASWIPAARAARVSPSRALRAE